MNKDNNVTVKDLKKKIEKFMNDRDWGQYHNPKNLSMSIAIEASELMENFQWVDSNQSLKILKDKDKRVNVEEELADIAIYVIDFCNMNDIDLTEIVEKKLVKNEKKYPVYLCKGKAVKYNQLRAGK